MPSTVWGLPTHPLIVHFVVVFIPMVALATLTVALWPRARRSLAPWVLGAATIAVLTIPLATMSGEHLESEVPSSPLVEEHAEMGDTLLPLAAAMWVTLAVIVAVGRYARRNADQPPRWTTAVTLVAVILAVSAAAGTGVQIVRIGHSGAKAVWHKVGTGQAGP